MFQNIKSKRYIIAIAVVVLVVAILGLLRYKAIHDNGYSVVYMTTGEVYVGHLTTFPVMELRDSYIFQVAKNATDPSQSNFQLQPVSKTFWALKFMRLNPKNVVFYGPLLPTSKIAETLASQGE